MIEIEREEKHKEPVGPDGFQQWRWHVRTKAEIRGSSREPLLDACRALKSLGYATDEAVGLFRPGSSAWELRTTIGYGSSLTVSEGRKESPHFVSYRPYNLRDLT